jgi:hypothetical protein
MKFKQPRPYADPDVAARKIVEIANTFEPIQDGRIYIEKINGPMLFVENATPAEYKAGLARAICETLTVAARRITQTRHEPRGGCESTLGLDAIHDGEW